MERTKPNVFLTFCIPPTFRWFDMGRPWQKATSVVLQYSTYINIPPSDNIPVSKKELLFIGKFSERTPEM